MKHSLASLFLVGATLLPGSLATHARAATMILHNLTGGASDGAGPFGSLTISDSKLYGLTRLGGSSGNGTLFSMNPNGTDFGLLHSFSGAAGDGSRPLGSLTLSGSKLYGTTYQGGSVGGGTLFSMNTDGTGFGLLHSFTGGPSDGAFPWESLTLSGSKLYGMTSGGGSNAGDGTVFSVNTDGTGFGLLHKFSAVSEGRGPSGSLTLSGSKLYGMTGNGSRGGFGSIFSMNIDGTGFSLLHSFAGGVGDGNQPQASLTLSGSKLYGMTWLGGSNNTGTLFSVNTDGTGFRLLHSFNGGTSDGSGPQGSLTLSGSTLYGMTRIGGSSNLGTIFSIGTDGTGFGLLESFGGPAGDGANPIRGPLTLSNDGSTLYGMTAFGGTANQGVVFSRAVVPEPGAGALLGSGAMLLLRRRRVAAR